MRTARTLLLLQLVLAVRVLARLLRTANGTRIAATDAPRTPGERVTILLPVLDERHRLAPCLDGLIDQGPEVAEILVIDGGSTDGTPSLVQDYAGRDARVRLLDASPVPAGWNGKVHGLQVGLDRAATDTTWVLTIDADVRPAPALARSLLAHARREGLPALSVATLQALSGRAEAMLHPALLTTLVYRFGIPGRATDRVADIQANGQCFLVHRDALVAAGGFAPTRDSVCEDVTLARTLAATGHRIGFFETDGLVSVAMYAGWRDAWRNWTRSLPMRDRFFGVAGWLGLVEVALVQAAPLPLAMLLRLGMLHNGGGRVGGRPGVETPGSTDEAPPGLSTGGTVTAVTKWMRSGEESAQALLQLNAMLAAVRLGLLVGTARAYRGRPWTYWLSPVCDVPAAVGVWLGAVRRRHEWRGRAVVRGGPG